jgi:hypothetical protein
MMTTTGIARRETPHVDDVPATPSAESGAPGGAPPLLPAPSPDGLGEDAIVAIAALLAHADEQDRTQARRLEDAAEVAAEHEVAARIDKLRDKASQDWSQGLASGVCGIAGGALTASSGFLPDGTSGSGGSSSGFNWRKAAEGTGQAATSLGSIVSAWPKSAADADDADAARFDAAAQADLRRYGAAQEDAQAAEGSIQKVEQFLQAALQARNETILGLTSALHR